MTGGGTSRLGWYARRLGRMSPAEIAWRAREQALRRAWRSRQVLPGQTAALLPLHGGGSAAPASVHCRLAA